MMEFKCYPVLFHLPSTGGCPAGEMRSFPSEWLAELAHIHSSSHIMFQQAATRQQALKCARSREVGHCRYCTSELPTSSSRLTPVTFFLFACQMVGGG